VKDKLLDKLIKRRGKLIEIRIKQEDNVNDLIENLSETLEKNK
jgi:hypothetical protein